MVQAVDANGVQNMADKIRHSVQRVIVGKDDVIDLAIIALLCKGHVLVEDVPGIGKTTMAKALAQSLGCTFNRIQFTPDLMPTDVLGVNFYNQKSGDFEFRAGPIFSQILLADEINRATPRTQSALLEAMGERQATIDGVTRAISEPFMVLATQNPIEMEGTFPLPEAQLDRFMLRIKLGYPSPDEESDILLRFQKDTILPALDPITTESELRPLQDAVTTVRVDDTIRMYVVAITQATREHDEIGRAHV
jgi:MoxR-like ATPase